jgi:hypothetical protein
MRFLTPLETLVACVLFAVVPATATRAATELPAITVTGKVTPSGDIVSRDRAQRSRDIHWPSALSPDSSPEMFAHNGIEINAPLATVWNDLVQAQLWPQWCPEVGKVKIKDGSQILQQNVRFTWSRDRFCGATCTRSPSRNTSRQSSRMAGRAEKDLGKSNFRRWTVTVSHLKIEPVSRALSAA